ncbi:gluconate 5-dehydrogenase [Diaporthe helianthi]|uniref:Gluconate 5-dehydrogenase n=1 Tax=Diaporthe helianthi TaxID=158607 RepID=A0A2P5HHC0_DIAHE|nr:gluconate 5-dehydrogenase [Diaporthe helianthi]
MDKRNELTSRVLPKMQFCPKEAATPAPKELPKDPSANPALERFKVSGNAIVTGGGGDLGSAACRALLEHGLQGLFVFDIDPVQAEQRLDPLRVDFPSARIYFRKVDITKEHDVETAVEDATAVLGQIHHLLCFAATVSCLPTAEVSAGEWRRVQEINTTGGFIIAQAVGKRMIASKCRGSIVFIGSISGHRVCYPQPQAAYNVSKAGVIMLKNCLAAEWAVHGIRVNSISPGYMDTILNEGEGLDDVKDVWLSRNPLGRMGDREELTGAVVLLSSRAGSYINGSDILVDGGQIVC